MRKVHLWMGLALGLLFALAGLTGSALVFYVEIDRALHPALWEQGAAPPASWEAALATLRRAYPDKDGPWRIEVVGDGGPVPARYFNPPETRGRDFAPMLVWLAPDASRVLRRAYWGETAMTWIYDLHYRLLLGEFGGAVMGWAGVAMLFLLASGLWAWWPRARNLAKAFAIKRGAAPVRRFYDWHKIAGLAAAPLLLLVAVTGAALDLPEETEAVLSSTVGTPVAPALEPPAWTGARMSVDAALARARAALPGTRLAWIETPGTGSGAYRFRFRVGGDPSPRFPHSYVFVHPTSGAVLNAHDVRRLGWANTIKNWLHPLHDGSAAGLTGRVLIFAAGVAPAVLLATGFLRWRLRRSKRKFR